MEKLLNIVYVVWGYKFLILIAITLLLGLLTEINLFRGKTLKAMLYAKNLAKDSVLKSGMEQENWVVEHLYLFIPKRWIFLINKILSEEMLRGIIQTLYRTSIDYIDDGKINKSFPLLL